MFFLSLSPASYSHSPLVGHTGGQTNGKKQFFEASYCNERIILNCSPTVSVVEKSNKGTMILVESYTMAMVGKSLDNKS